jgi:CheY-like chemotaxis protein
VVVASDGYEALEALERERFDLVLMDCMMPGMDGFRATAEIRHREVTGPGGRRLPIIALTAAALAGERERCLAAGMDDYLSKPVRPPALERTIARWVAPDLIRETSAVLASPEPMLGGGSASNSASAPSASPVRAEALDAIRRHGPAGPAILERVLQTFLGDTPEKIGQLRVALSDRDLSTAHRLAHTLKSSCAIVGAERLSAMCKDLERRAREAEQPIPPDEADAIETEYSEVAAALAALLETESSDVPA